VVAENEWAVSECERSEPSSPTPQVATLRTEKPRGAMWLVKEEARHTATQLENIRMDSARRWDRAGEGDFLFFVFGF
jgi:hypothetical protein